VGRGNLRRKEKMNQVGKKVEHQSPPKTENPPCGEVGLKLIFVSAALKKKKNTRVKSPENRTKRRNTVMSKTLWEVCPHFVRKRKKSMVRSLRKECR